MKRNNPILTLLCPLFVAACTGVDFNPEKPEEQCYLVLKSGNEGISSARALLSRTINEVHYLYAVDETQIHEVGVGEYCATAISCDETIFDLKEVNDFSRSQDISLKQVKVYAPRSEQQIMMERMKIDELDFVDMAASYPVIECNEPLYRAFIKRDIKPSSPIANDEPEVPSADTISFNFEDATMTLNFSIHIEAGDDVEIENVFGCITGIPSYLYIMDGETDRSSLAKTYFRFEDNGSGMYCGSIRTFGLFLQEKDDYLTGNGITFIYIIAKTADTRRVIHPTPFNLKKFYPDTDIMKPSAKGRFILLSHSENIQLPPETISKGVISSANDESAQWLIKDDTLDLDDVEPLIPWL